MTSVDPFYFEADTARLFGVMTPATPRDRASRAVLLCHAIGQEYMRSYQALRQLSLALHRAGVPVLRFDYYGTGDSEGSLEEARVSRWVSDISCACDVLKARSGASKLAIVGFRLGAALAANAVFERSDVSELVAWQMPSSGASWLEEARAAHREHMANSVARARAQSEEEILGFPYSDGLVQDILAIDPAVGPRLPLDRVLIIGNGVAEASGDVPRHWQRLGAHVEQRIVPSRSVWLKEREQDYGSAVGSRKLVSAIVEWLVGIVAHG